MLVTISGRTFYLSGLCTQTVISCTHNGFTRIHVWLLWIRDIYLYYGTSAVDWRRHNAIWALSRWFFKISRFHFCLTLILRFEQNLMCKCFLRINFALSTVFFIYLSTVEWFFNFVSPDTKKVFLHGHFAVSLFI